MALREDRSIPDASACETDGDAVPAARSRPPARPLAPVAEPRQPAADAPEASVALAPPPAEPARPKPSRRKLVAAVLLPVLLLGGGYQGWSYWTTGRFMVSTDDAYVAADITILAAKVSGYVADLKIQNNQSVEAGAVIATIDDVDYQLSVRSARDRIATLEATAARVGSQIEAARAQVAQAEPQIDAAEADRVRAEADLDRQVRLTQSDFASKARLEQSRADRDRAVATKKGAEAALLFARANVDVLEAQAREASRTADEARTQAARAERDLSFATIRAPVAGTVGNRAVEVGSYVQAGTRLMALIPLATVHVDANFKETQLAGIVPGQRAHLEVDAYPGRDIPASVESIAPASGSQFSLLPPENATGNFTKIVQRVPVRVKVDPAFAAQGLLRPGMSVVVRIDTRDRAPDSGRAVDPGRAR